MKALSSAIQQVSTHLLTCHKVPFLCLTCCVPLPDLDLQPSFQFYMLSLPPSNLDLQISFQFQVLSSSVKPTPSVVVPVSVLTYFMLQFYPSVLLSCVQDEVVSVRMVFCCILELTE